MKSVNLIDVDFAKVELEIAARYIRRERHPVFDLYIHNYTQTAAFDSHWNNETRACRGLITNAGNEIKSRPFPKFYTYDQIRSLGDDNPLDRRLRRGEKFSIFEKMDGSLGISYFGDDGLPYVATRGSFVSEQAIKATELLREKYQFTAMRYDRTYLFEIIYPQNRIVVNYGDSEMLVLLAVIKTEDGSEVGNDELNATGTLLGMPVAGSYVPDDFESLVAYAQREENVVAVTEGWVIRFDSDNFRTKIKFEEYKRQHRLTFSLSTKLIWESLMRNGGDTGPLMNLLPDDDKAIIDWALAEAAKLKGIFGAIISQTAKNYGELVGLWEHGKLPERKDLAAAVKHLPNPHLLFQMWDGKSIDETVWKMVKPKQSETFRTVNLSAGETDEE